MIEYREEENKLGCRTSSSGMIGGPETGLTLGGAGRTIAPECLIQMGGEA